MLGFIEGRMERQFINNNMKYVHVVPINNGITWTVDRLCSQIATAYRALNMQCEIFVWIDREGRQQSSYEIFSAVRDTLLSCGANPDSIHIMIYDRMTENLILADEVLIKEEFNDPDYTYQHEGRSGKTILKEMYNQLGVAYKEMDHGVHLLKKVRVSRSAENSPSASRFLQTFDKDCWWVAHSNRR